MAFQPPRKNGHEKSAPASPKGHSRQGKRQTRSAYSYSVLSTKKGLSRQQLTPVHSQIFGFDKVQMQAFMPQIP
jgi:hypothetical protein